MKQLAARGLSFDRDAGLAAAAMLDDAHEQAVLSSLTRYPEILEQAAVNRAPHTLAHYLRDLRSEEHTSELQSQSNLVCRLLLEKKKRPKPESILFLRDCRLFQLNASSAGCTRRPRA